LFISGSPPQEDDLAAGAKDPGDQEKKSNVFGIGLSKQPRIQVSFTG